MPDQQIMKEDIQVKYGITRAAALTLLRGRRQGYVKENLFPVSPAGLSLPPDLTSAGGLCSLPLSS